MSDNKWHSGPPPSVGWWPADRYRSNEIVRWWDGKRWSISFWKENDGYWPMKDANLHPSPYSKYIKWRHRPASWPARSRT